MPRNRRRMSSRNMKDGRVAEQRGQSEEGDPEDKGKRRGRKEGEEKTELGRERKRGVGRKRTRHFGDFAQM